MTDIRHVAVIDIGKSNAKVALVDLDTSREMASRKRPNTPKADGPYPHHDVDAIWGFILEGLAKLRREHPVDAVSVTTHGATAALVDRVCELVLPLLDYEFDGPDRLREAYDEVRPPFSETGTPKLPGGLNLGAQLFWLQKTFPEAFGKVNAILTYPQFWSARLTGVPTSEVTSLGCHTDLWNPYAAAFSSLVDRMGWQGLFPPLRKAGDTLGPILPEIASSIGLEPGTPVACGIHDSNASLLPHLLSRQQPFSVVSTGTWVVAMAIGERPTRLDADRDTLVNANAFGNPVPSARFMGGREFETVMQGHLQEWTDDDVEAVLSGSCMLLPSVQPGSGPFPALQGGWVDREPRCGERFVATSFYLALMTATCLDLIGAEGDIVVEGPFAANPPYLSMLSHATERRVATSSNSTATGTSIGAALLLGESRKTALPTTAVVMGRTSNFEQYAELWRSRLATT